MKNLTLTMLFFAFLSCKNSNKKVAKQIQTEVKKTELKIEKPKKLSISNGTWISTIDSLASVEINDTKWIFKYLNEKTESDDYYNYHITESVFDKKNDLIGGSLILYKETDTLKYRIDYITNKNMTLIYLARGNFHHYIKKE